jgi:hypothetical protein
MITTLLKNAETVDAGSYWIVMHPSGFILAECDTYKEAEKVRVYLDHFPDLVDESLAFLASLSSVLVKIEEVIEPFVLEEAKKKQNLKKLLREFEAVMEPFKKREGGMS